MRAPRTLAAVGLTVSLLAIPALSFAQSDASPEAGDVPLARLPLGQLPLEGTPWRLEAYADGGREATPGPEVAAFISFSVGSVEGSGGCSKVRGRYGVNGAALTVELKQRAGRSCPENLAIVQRAVENGLEKAGAYELVPGQTPAQDRLVIRSIGGGELLRYGLDDLSVLGGAAWKLAGYTQDGSLVSASEEMPGFITFEPASDAYFKRRQSGPISASTGCNGVVAEYFRHSDVLSFSELQVTDAPCTAELEAQQSAMIAVLEATAARLDLPADRLTLTSADTGERLEFVSQTPLEGTTWWLRSTAGTGQIDDQRITLRLESGVAGGQGPCGPYRAGYVTDGLFITFRDVTGAEDDGCAQLRTERALVSGLRHSVLVVRGAAALSFHDALAEATLEFHRPMAP